MKCWLIAGAIVIIPLYVICSWAIHFYVTFQFLGGLGRGLMLLSLAFLVIALSYAVKKELEHDC